MDVAQQPTGILEGEKPPDKPHYSIRQFFIDQKKDMYKALGKRQMILEKENGKPVARSDAVGDFMDNYLEAWAHGRREGACFLKGLNDDESLEREESYLRYAPEKDYKSPLLERVECPNLRNMLENEHPEILRAAIGYTRIKLAEEINVGPNRISNNGAETVLGGVFNAWLDGLRYQYCETECSNGDSCERRKEDLDKFAEYIES